MAVTNLLKKPYSLICGLPPQQGGTEIEDFTNRAFRVKASSRRIGGCWVLTWWFPLSDKDIGHRIQAVHNRGRRRASDYLLKTWFEHRLMHTITLKVGGKPVWKGVVWEQELTLNGSKKRRTVDDVFNAIKVFYIDEADVVQETAWHLNNKSIARYGRRELAIDMEEASEDEADAEAQSELLKLSEAWKKPLAFGKRMPEGLEVTAVGLIYTANNKYTSAGDGSSDDSDVYIREIIETDCEFVTPGRLASNSLQTQKTPGLRKRAWETLLEIMKRGDGTNPWKLWADAAGYIHYQPEDNTPFYEWHGEEKGLITRVGSVNPWSIQPGVLRDKTEPDGRPIPGSFLLQSNDSWIDEVEMADGNEAPTVKPGGIDENEITRAQQNYENWLEQESQQASDEAAQ